MKSLGEVVGLGIWEGIIKTLRGRYFKSTGSSRHYFYFPEANINSPLDVNHKNTFKIHSFSNLGDVSLRVVRYNDDVFNPTKIMTLINLNDLFIDYTEISKEQFELVANRIEEEVNKYK